MPLKVMFDTNIFNCIIKGEIDISSLQDQIQIFATHIQYDELSKTSNQDLRERFLALFHEVTNTTPTDSYVVGTSRIGEAKFASNVVSTESAVWGVSKWDEAKWSGKVISAESAIYGVSRYGIGSYGGSNLCSEIRKKLDALNKAKENNSEDALIAETAILNKFVLVTHDRDLFSVVTIDFQSAVLNLFSLLGGVNYIRF